MAWLALCSVLGVGRGRAINTTMGIELITRQVASTSKLTASITKPCTCHTGNTTVTAAALLSHNSPRLTYSTYANSDCNIPWVSDMTL